MEVNLKVPVRVPSEVSVIIPSIPVGALLKISEVVPLEIPAGVPP